MTTPRALVGQRSGPIDIHTPPSTNQEGLGGKGKHVTHVDHYVVTTGSDALLRKWEGRGRIRNRIKGLVFRMYVVVESGMSQQRDIFRFL